MSGKASRPVSLADVYFAYEFTLLMCLYEFFALQIKRSWRTNFQWHFLSESSDSLNILGPIAVRRMTRDYAGIRFHGDDRSC